MIDILFPKLHKEGYRFLAIAAVVTFILLIFFKFSCNNKFYINYVGLLLF